MKQGQDITRRHTWPLYVQEESLWRMPLGQECPLCHTVVSPYSGVACCSCSNRLRIKHIHGHVSYRWTLKNAHPTNFFPPERAAEPRASECVAVVGDVHGNLEPLKAVMQAAGVIDKQGRRQANFKRVIQLGDLMDGRRMFGDLQTLRWAEGIFDEILIGNHEGAYLGVQGFAGKRIIAPESQQILNRWNREGLLCAATAVDDYLLTHGGLDPFLSFLPAPKLSKTADATEVSALAKNLNEVWRFHRSTNAWESWFLAIGRERNGLCAHGGVLWNDFERLVRTESAQRFKQIVGHTPLKRGTRSPQGMVVCIDVGGAWHRAASCLIISPEGTRFFTAGTQEPYYTDQI